MDGMSVLLLILGLVLFVGLVVVHEFGHFIMARRGGVDVEEFGIGFPPRAWGKKLKSGLLFTINWLPLGGFVRLKGEHDNDTHKGSFGAAPLGTKVKIMLAGVVMNLLTAVFLFTLLAFVGLPKANLEQLPFYQKEQFSVKSDTRIVSNEVLVAVVPDSPAAAAGLQDGDELISLAGEDVALAENLSDLTAKNAGKTVPIVYARGGEQKTAEVTLNQESTREQPHLGVAPANSQIIRATWSAPIVGAAVTAQYFEVSLRGIGYALSNLFQGNTQEAQNAVGGPVAIVKTLSDFSELGILYILFIIAIISISLALMNVLPIPALDGGRLFVMLLFRAFKKPLKPRTEDLIHGTGFAALMVLFVLITIVDVKRFF